MTERATQPADHRVRDREQPVGDPARLDDPPEQQEQRHGEEGEVVDALEDLIGEAFERQVELEQHHE